MESAPPIEGTINVVGHWRILWLHGLFYCMRLAGGRQESRCLWWGSEPFCLSFRGRL